jgi:hypothetical protein
VAINLLEDLIPLLRQEDVRRVERRLPDTHLQLARLYAEVLDYTQAVSHARIAVTEHNTCPDYGPDHPDTLTARSDLAQWTGEAGDRATARDLFAELLPVEERVLGPHHPNTLAARNNLAHWTGQAGDSATARDLTAELLPALERVLGPEHPSTLTTSHNLAQWTGKAATHER